jgi:putative ATP-dependent endonuclease of OLD family
MFLYRVRVENFRGFERISVAFEDTTVLIGENNYGKTSLLDVLAICLGNHPDDDAFPFCAADFRRRDGDETATGPIKVTLTFRERSGKKSRPWRKSKLSEVLVRGPRNSTQLVLRVVATKQPKDEAISVQWYFVDRDGEPTGPADDTELISELRRLSPFLLLGTERVLFARDSPAPDPADDSSPEDASRRGLERMVERTYRELTTSRAPMPSEVLERGTRALERLIERAAPRFQPNAENPRRLLDQVVQTPIPLAFGSQGAGLQAIAKLLLFGAVLEARGEDALAPEARPIYGIEEPEAHLHPQTLAAVWALIAGFKVQKIVTTNSSELLAAVPLRSVRRMMRRRGSIEIFRPGNKLTVDEMRRIGYHIRVRRGEAMFARCWLLIEGETEFWLLPELARLMGYEFPTEGVRCIEFAQAGVEPLVKLANEMGIEWHLLADGDKAGKYYRDAARLHLRRDKERERITLLRHVDIEHSLWHHGYAGVYRRLAGPGYSRSRRRSQRPATIIRHATHRRSKPGVALAVVEAAAAEGSPGVPPILQRVIETVVRLARSC